MIKAVLFDFDGTIADTLGVCVDAFKLTVEPLLGRSLELDEIRMKYFGPTEEGIFATHFPERQAELLAVYLEHYARLQAEAPPLADGIMPLISALKRKGVRVALITAKGAQSCKISLEFYGLQDAFEFIEVGGSQGRVKDQAILLVLDKMGIERADAIYVGDSPKDVISAHKAGVASWSAAWMRTANPAQILANNPERIFYTVAEFQTALESELGALN